MSGPLKGLKVIEFGGIGPGPFCAMMLADMGADVIRLDRKTDKGKDRDAPGFLFSGRRSVLHRGRRSAAVDLKSAADRDKVMSMIDDADALIEGYRPGVMERLGLGPDVLLARNPRLVYGRMTGWGQDGPLAQAAGHDINYIALSGALATIGRKAGGPVAPAAMIGDLGGGGMMLAFGIVCAILESRASGHGQVVDAAVLDGAALLTSIVCELRGIGAWTDERESNLLDGGSHFYDTYECADTKWISIGALEPQFYALLLDKLDITDPAFQRQRDPAAWPELIDSEVFNLNYSSAASSDDDGSNRHEIAVARCAARKARAGHSTAQDGPDLRADCGADRTEPHWRVQHLQAPRSGGREGLARCTQRASDRRRPTSGCSSGGGRAKAHY